MVSKKLHHILLSALDKTILLCAFLLAFGLACLASWGLVTLIEARTEKMVTSRLLEAGITWAEVSTDGLRITIAGTAPNEAARFRAISQVSSVVQASRINDALDVVPLKEIEPPHFSIEILRNDDGIQLIGLLPSESDVDALLAEANKLNPAEGGVLDMLESAVYPPPKTWDTAFTYALGALRLLPRAQISVTLDGVRITAIAQSPNEKRRFESELKRLRPSNLPVTIDISAPRPILTPFILRFVKDAEGARFDACAADTPLAQSKIIAAGKAAGAPENAACVVGLGAPSPSWANAAVMSIEAASALNAASVTISDADVSFVAGDSVSKQDFDKVVGDLQNRLPDVFSLTSKLETPPETNKDQAQFTAIIDDNGVIELRGRLTDVRQSNAVKSYAQSRFGVDNVRIGTVLDENTPADWAIRVLASLEALSVVTKGQLTLSPDQLQIKGVSGQQDAPKTVSQILATRLGDGQSFQVDIRYDPTLDSDIMQSHEACFARLEDVQSKDKITFAPSSSQLDAHGLDVIASIAKTIIDCAGLPVEISGHTDDQGRDEINMELSQKRAEAVLLALKLSGVDASGMIAKGYGESQPIADNATEAGREANRRIGFTLLVATYSNVNENNP